MKIWNIVFVGLCAIWLAGVYLAADPEPPWDWRIVAAFLQAILSAGAIYTAWWLQNRKRQSDRNDEVADNIHLAVHMSALYEWDAAVACETSLDNGLNKATATVYSSGLRKHDEMLRKVSISKLPDGAVRPFLGLLQKTEELAASMEYVGANTEQDAVPVRWNLVLLYRQVHDNRTGFLSAVGTNPEPQRFDPAVFEARVKGAVPLEGGG